MLKLTYTDNKLSLDCFKQSLEDWINTRVLLNLRSATSIYLEPSTASLLIPAESSYLGELEKFRSENILEFCRCDPESVEVVLKGIWLTSQIESETGVFVTEMDKYTEFLLHKMFDCKLLCYA